MQVMVVGVCEVRRKTFSRPGNFQQRGTPRWTAVAPQQLVQRRVHLFQFRPAQFWEFGNYFLCAHAFGSMP